ncbi:MAG: COG4280 domain-containing protein [Solirubrobacteraceae bacterium]
MSGSEIGLAVSVFLACAVEAVEALTIVLAVGSTRSWSSSMYGASAATAILAVLTGALGPALTSLPIDVLRLLVGGLLLVFGLQWLRKAILRATGLKALHDEAQEFEQQRRAAETAAAGARRIDSYSFLLSFKGVLLEGLEVVFIVLTFGANQHHVGIAAIAAAAAVVLVVLVGAVAKAPLTRVPENTLKFVVGVMLTSFGMFWGTEGAGAHWPGSDLALLVLVPCVAIFALATVSALRRLLGGSPASRAHGEHVERATDDHEHVERATDDRERVERATDDRERVERIATERA